MNRFLQRMAVLVAAASLAGAAFSQSFEEGVHFERIEGPDVEDSDGQVEVVEVFSYLCPHCRNFHPVITEWAETLPDHVEYRRVPVLFQRGLEPFVRAYYTAEAMGILEESHGALFEALHDERQNIRTLDDLVEFHSQFGVEAGEFRSTARSFSVDSKVRQTNAQVGRWQVRATPSVVINDKWRISPRRGGSFDEMIDVINHLVEKESGIELEGAETEDAADS